jgi:hypothetical protein
MTAVGPTISGTLLATRPAISRGGDRPLRVLETHEHRELRAECLAIELQSFLATTVEKRYLIQPED